MKTVKQNIFGIFVSVILVVGVTIAGCDAPAGPEGAEGPQGPAGPVGPAGEDGSVMYAGEGEPNTDIGDLGDYYLNQDNGELYGPKDEDGWGNPIIVLMGEDGADGQDGQDGADGEDGSQIYSGSGGPDAELGAEGDYYLDKHNYELYGPKTGSGWGTPINIKGADGNENVTRYIFPGHDFRAQVDGGDGFRARGCFEKIFLSESTAWLYYLTDTRTPPFKPTKYSIPGWGINGDSSYRAHLAGSSPCDWAQWTITKVDGPGEEYDQIEVIRIESGETVDMTKQKSSDSIIPDHLDISNYNEVAEYYGFYK